MLRSASKIDEWADRIGATQGEEARREYLDSMLGDESQQIGARRERLRSLANDGRPGRLERERSELHGRSGDVDERLPQQVLAAHDEGLRAIATHESLLSTRPGLRRRPCSGCLAPAGHPPGRARRVGRERGPLNRLDLPCAEAQVAVRRVAQQLHKGRLVVTLAGEQRAMSEGTGSAGGFALPFTLDPTILFSSSGALNPFRQLARVETIITREWRGLTADTPTAAYAAEGTEASDNSPTLVQPDIFAEKAQMFVPFSIELEQDWTTLHAQLQKLFSDAKDILEATKFLSGLGHGNSPPEPVGILSVGTTGALTTTQRVQTATVATFAAGDPWLLKAAIPPRWIPSCVFFGAPGTWDTNLAIRRCREHDAGAAARRRPRR